MLQVQGSCFRCRGRASGAGVVHWVNNAAPCATVCLFAHPLCVPPSDRPPKATQTVARIFADYGWGEAVYGGQWSDDRGQYTVALKDKKNPKVPPELYALEASGPDQRSATQSLAALLLPLIPGPKPRVPIYEVYEPPEICVIRCPPCLRCWGVARTVSWSGGPPPRETQLSECECFCPPPPGGGRGAGPGLRTRPLLPSPRPVDKQRGPSPSQTPNKCTISNRHTY